MMSMIATVHDRRRQRLAEAGLARQAQPELDLRGTGDMTSQQVMVLLWEYNVYIYIIYNVYMVHIYI